jgi:flagellar biogenesis protein FliO
MLRIPIQPFAALSWASEAGPPTSLGGTEGPDLTRYLVVCSLLLLGILALAWGFRRLVGKNLAARAAQRSLEVMDVLPMGGKQRLAVVRCYDRTFLLGMGEKELSLVAELDGVIEPEQENEPTLADRKAFADLLSRALPSRAVPAVRAATKEPVQPEARPNGLGAGVLG